MKAKREWPLISIITITKDDHVGLSSTYESISSQIGLMDLPIEWIVINGSSSSRTEKFLASIKPEFACNFISEPDEGVFDAMNKGVQFSCGRYLIFLNSGDIFFDRNVLFDNKAYLLEGSFNIIAGMVNMEWRGYSYVGSLEPWVCHQAVFISSKLFNEYQYDQTLKFYGDLDFWKLLRKQGKFLVKRINRPTVTFQMGGIGNSPKYIIKRMIERIKINRRYGDGLGIIPAYLFNSIFLFVIWKVFGIDTYYRFILGWKIKDK